MTSKRLPTLSVYPLADTANQAGWRVHTLPIEQIRWEPGRRRFVDHRNEPISALFKLYPWEWMRQDAFAVELPRSSMMVLEPAWKQVLRGIREDRGLIHGHQSRFVPHFVVKDVLNT